MPLRTFHETTVENFSGGSAGQRITESNSIFTHIEDGHLGQFSSGGRTGLCAGLVPNHWDLNGFEPDYGWSPYDEAPPGFQYAAVNSLTYWIRHDRIQVGSGPTSIPFTTYWPLLGGAFFELLLEYDVDGASRPNNPRIRVEASANPGSPTQVVGRIPLAWNTWQQVRIDWREWPETGLLSTITVGGSSVSFRQDFRPNVVGLEWSIPRARTVSDGPTSPVVYDIEGRFDDLTLDWIYEMRVDPDPPTITQPLDGSRSTERSPVFRGTRTPNQSGTSIRVYNAADDSLIAWTDDPFPDGSSTWSAPLGVTPLRPGTYTVYAIERDDAFRPSPRSNLVTFTVLANGSPATRMYPRDDALGLGSAPRIHPPPKRGRVVGGYR